MKPTHISMETATFDNKNRIYPIGQRMLYRLLVNDAKKGILPGTLLMGTKQGSDSPYIVMKVVPKKSADAQAILETQQAYIAAINEWSRDGYPKIKKVAEFRKKYLKNKK